MNFSAVILAGGRSTRMGRDKAWLPWHGRPLIAHQIATVRRLRPVETFVSGRNEAPYAELGVPVLLDAVEGQGPLSGIERALACAHAPMVLVLAVDMPRMTTPTLRRLAAGCSTTRGAIPLLGDQIEPLAAFYPKTAGRAVRTMLEEGQNAAASFASLCVQLGLARFVEFRQDEQSAFTNWNAPDDLVRKRRRRR
jgi:molybdopterin-guanine dinucleotide biosynthesis protein A